MVFLLTVGFPLQSQETATATAAEHFVRMAAWEGRWSVVGNDALTIVFERTAAGHTLVERWQTRSGLHSMTVYHLAGNVVMATHYCPQGNQPRLVALPGTAGQVHFVPLDITGLDAGESHAISIDFMEHPDGSLDRTEIYADEGGPGLPDILTLTRSPDPQ
ncbi:hypothetical protein [Qipengyuania spongiae]|uniref:DUF1579 domain-containing protein n=1 Tax=Qipengyuania spongiae TaxID=2909673 RepID=A0ABY5SYG1_9SPHN|nr:hypothetical protein [Qipengyuania spongiae]UVI38116.1 hypothetical protein L1F33_07470 [Qipengyuania spongiae]